MIPAILATREGVEIEVDSQTVFSCPFDAFKEISIKIRIILFVKIDRRDERRMYMKTHVHAVLARKGSVSRVSIAQNGTGMRTKLSPAPAICAKSCSVFRRKTQNILTILFGYVMALHVTYDECFIMFLELLQSPTRCVCGHCLAECPFVYRGSGVIQVFLKDRRRTEFGQIISPVISEAAAKSSTCMN